MNEDQIIALEIPYQTAPPRVKANFIGAPACFQLEMACRMIHDSFDGFGCYLVGSSIKRADWRDVDIRFIMSDAQFDALFPGVGRCWEQDSRWLLLTTSISLWLSDQTGLKVDFQFQPQTYANERFRDGERHAIGFRLGKPTIMSKEA